MELWCSPRIGRIIVGKSQLVANLASFFVQETMSYCTCLQMNNVTSFTLQLGLLVAKPTAISKTIHLVISP